MDFHVFIHSWNLNGQTKFQDCVVYRVEENEELRELEGLSQPTCITLNAGVNLNNDKVPPCTVTLRPRGPSTHSLISAIDLVSDAKCMEIFAASGEYLTTVFGVPLGEVVEDRSLHLLQYSFTKPMRSCTTQLVSLTDPASVTIHSFNVTVVMPPSAPLFSGSPLNSAPTIDVSKVKDMLKDMDCELSKNAKNLLSSMESSQKQRHAMQLPLQSLLAAFASGTSLAPSKHISGKFPDTSPVTHGSGKDSQVVMATKSDGDDSNFSSQTMTNSPCMVHINTEGGNSQDGQNCRRHSNPEHLLQQGTVIQGDHFADKSVQSTTTMSDTFTSRVRDMAIKDKDSPQTHRSATSPIHQDLVSSQEECTRQERATPHPRIEAINSMSASLPESASIDELLKESRCKSQAPASCSSNDVDVLHDITNFKTIAVVNEDMTFGISTKLSPISPVLNYNSGTHFAASSATLSCVSGGTELSSELQTYLEGLLHQAELRITTKLTARIAESESRILNAIFRSDRTECRSPLRRSSYTTDCNNLTSAHSSVASLHPFTDCAISSNGTDSNDHSRMFSTKTHSEVTHIEYIEDELE